MVSVVIYGIIAIALAAAAGYALLVFTNTAQQTTQMQENSVRMEQALTALRASLRAIDGDGILYLPAGSQTASNGTTIYGLPLSLGIPTATPWGTPYQYCPVTTPVGSRSSTGTDSVTMYNSTAYSISTYTGSTTGGVPYVSKAPF